MSPGHDISVRRLVHPDAAQDQHGDHGSQQSYYHRSQAQGVPVRLSQPRPLLAAGERLGGTVERAPSLLSPSISSTHLIPLLPAQPRLVISRVVPPWMADRGWTERGAGVCPRKALGSMEGVRVSWETSERLPPR